MGAWGTGNLENDDAADFLVEFQENGAKVLEQVLDIAIESDYLEAPDAARALAAAEIIAISIDGSYPDDPLSEELKITVDKNRQAIMAALKGLRQQCLAAIARVRAESSELDELWKESDDYSDWQDVLAELEARVS